MIDIVTTETLYTLSHHIDNQSFYCTLPARCQASHICSVPKENHYSIYLRTKKNAGLRQNTKHWYVNIVLGLLPTVILITVLYLIKITLLVKVPWRRRKQGRKSLPLAPTLSYSTRVPAFCQKKTSQNLQHFRLTSPWTSPAGKESRCLPLACYVGFSSGTASLSEGVCPSSVGSKLTVHHGKSLPGSTPLPLHRIPLEYRTLNE